MLMEQRRREADAYRLATEARTYAEARRLAGAGAQTRTRLQPRFRSWLAVALAGLAERLDPSTAD
jgi:hypothetical protein